MKWILILLLMVGGAGKQLVAQLPDTCIAYSLADDSLILDSLRASFGHNKKIPPIVELQALRALSHYPELRYVNMDFVFCRQKTAHSSQPKISSLLRRASRRTYLIRISLHVPAFYLPGSQLKLPYNAQIGVLGHELAHAVQYLRRGLGGLLADGLRYGSSAKYVVCTEHLTDQIAIDHHLGWQLLAWAQIARPLLEQAGRGQNYMRPAEIEAQLKAH